MCLNHEARGRRFATSELRQSSVPRTLHLHWPTLHDDRAATQLRNATHALGRISPLVASGARQIEIGIDGLQARNGDESAVASAALRAVATHIRTAPRAAIASSRLAAAVAAAGSVADDAACTILPPGSEVEFLAPQRVEALRFAATGRSAEELAEAIERCSLLGVRTLGALARLRSGELGARLGAIAGLLIPLARGEDVQAIPPVPLPRRLVARESFDLPLTSIEEFRFPLRRALDDLLARVRRDGAAVGLVRLHVARERGRPLRAVARLPLPTTDRTQIERLLLAALERAVAAARAERLDVDGLVSAQLQFDGVLPASGDQLTLLGARSPRVDRLAWSTAAIAIRYGADRVVHAEIVDPDDARPERRTRLVRAHPEVGE
jgi:hypothetical protein